MAGEGKKAPEYKDIATTTAGRTITGDDSRAEAVRNYGYQEETGDGAGDWFANLLTTDYFWNNNREPAPSFNFFLRIEGAFDAPCKSVRAFTKENDFEEIQEGGRNDYVILKRKPISRRFTLQVERYVGIDKIDPLQLGTEMVLPMILAVSRVTASSSGFADTLSETEFIRFYAFTGCIVTGKEYGELNAEQSGLLKEVTTIAYREMVAITTPNADMVEKPWNIVEWDKNRKDKNARANDPFPEWNKARAEGRLWTIPQQGDEETAKENRSAARPIKDDTKQTAKSWDIPKKGQEASAKSKRSAVVPATDAEKQTPKSWEIPKTGGPAASRAKRSATVNDNSDRARASLKAWVMSRNPDPEKRSADIPNSDARRARVKSWNVSPTGSKISKAVKPSGDRRKARIKGFSIKKPEKYTAAEKPKNDKDRAEVVNFLNGGKRAR